MRWGCFELGSKIRDEYSHVVYEAQDTVRNRRVALSRPRNELTMNAEEHDQFDREARALAAIRHPGLVEILDHGEIEGQPFMALAPVEGNSLRPHIRSDQRPDARMLCTALAATADGLHALHTAGVPIVSALPSSITLTPTGEGVLHDFGFACPLHRITLRRADADTLGRPLHMSPEQVLGRPEPTTAATEVYALGATLYVYLTGQPPFRTDNLQELLCMILRQKPRAPHRVDRSVPRAVSRIASRCLAKNPQDRYATAADLAIALRTALL